MASRIATTMVAVPEPSRADGVEGGSGGSRALSRRWRRGRRWRCWRRPLSPPVANGVEDSDDGAGGDSRALPSRMGSRIAMAVAPEPSLADGVEDGGSRTSCPFRTALAPEPSRVGWVEDGGGIGS
uniref:DUF834 domain-containing protein n=1 Tax=Oryza meridionalis TaxID=40149 RepID=A0A0E0DYG4_9ORYZ